jgi:hypothetical protein
LPQARPIFLATTPQPGSPSYGPRTTDRQLVDRNDKRGVKPPARHAIVSRLETRASVQGSWAWHPAAESLRSPRADSDGTRRQW